MSFRTTQASLKKKISPTPPRSKSNLIPSTQGTDTRQRKNTHKAAEALHYLVKLSFLGKKSGGISYESITSKRVFC